MTNTATGLDLSLPPSDVELLGTVLEKLTLGEWPNAVTIERCAPIIEALDTALKAYAAEGGSNG